MGRYVVGLTEACGRRKKTGDGVLREEFCDATGSLGRGGVVPCGKNLRNEMTVREKREGRRRSSGHVAYRFSLV